jgi:hypothetical protein
MLNPTSDNSAYLARVKRAERRDKISGLVFSALNVGMGAFLGWVVHG